MKNVLVSILVAIGFFLAFELGARLFQSVYGDLHRIRAEAQSDDREWSVFSPEVGWTLRPNYRGDVGGYRRVFDAQGHLAVDTKQIADTGARKVLFIGDSNTFGVGTPTEHSFAEATERLSPGLVAINLGVPGYTSFQGRRVLDRALADLHPAAVVVSFNFNDKKYALPQLGSDSPEMIAKVVRSAGGPAAMIRECIQYSAAMQMMTQGLQRLHLLPKRSGTFRVDRMPTRVDPQHYRENLRAMAGAANQHGAKMVFLILRDNPLYTQPVTEGIALLDSARYDDAIAHLRYAVHADNAFSEVARLQLARAFRALGRPAAADSVLESQALVTTVFGGRPIHLDSEYNAIMREVAAETGAAVVDAGPMLLSHPNDFTDYCHFDAASHERVGAMIAATLRGLLGASSPPLASK
jgi:lysophospholipase L1-like esterase